MNRGLMGISIMVALLLATTVQSSEESGKMYRWTDENGVVHYSDQRPPGQEVQEQAIPLDPGPDTDAGDPGGQTPAEPSLAQQRREEIARKHEQERERQAANASQCAAWQAEVDRLEPNRRVFYTNEEGETERMDDVERTDRVAQLKGQISKNCQ